MVAKHTKINIETHGDKVKKEMLDRLHDTAEASGKRSLRDARRRIDDHTGTLSNSGRVTPWRKKHAVGCYVGFTAPHSHLVEFGTKGKRYPAKKKVMKFTGPNGQMFAKEVKPMPAKPFFRPSVKKEGPKFKKGCMDAQREVSRG